MRSWLKLAIEVGPLVVFFLANGRDGFPELRHLWLPAGAEPIVGQALFEATGAFMIATVVALLAGWLVERRIPVLPLVSGLFVLVFGALTLALADETFIKMKPTLVNSLFAVILFGGLAAGRPLLKPLFGAAMALSDHAWRLLTWRWAGFFVVLAILNEVVWRTASTDFWVSFKLFGIMPLTILFAAAQTPLILREQEQAEAAAPGAKPEAPARR